MPSSLWVFLLIVLTIVIITVVGFAAHRIITNYADYNHVVEKDIFINGRHGYLNVGLWSEGAAEFGDAQRAMYLLFFSLAELHRKDLRVLETGCGTGEHYLLWKEHGLQSAITSYEIGTATHPDVLKEKNIRVYQKSALDLKSRGVFDRIIAIESAFHYPNRQRFFQKCYAALKPGGMLLLADIIINKQARERRWLQRGVQYYYEKCIFKIPPENSIGIEEYARQLQDCRFSSVRVVDITQNTLKPFYEDFYRHVRVEHGPEWIQALYRRCIDTAALWNAFTYVLVVCVK